MTTKNRNDDAGGGSHSAPNWPTHEGSAGFWEELGRTVATFGMLEDTLGKALFTATAQKQVSEGKELEREMAAWGAKVISGFSDTLGGLTKNIKVAWKQDGGGLSAEHAKVLKEIEELAKERNRLCHGAWMAFKTKDEGLVRYYPQGKELDGGHMVTRSLSEIAETRKRATTVIKAVLADMGVRNKTVFAKASWTSRNPT